MNAVISNDIGMITLSQEVIAAVAGLAATECYGVVGMAVKNVKDGIVTLLKKENLKKGVVIKISENNEVKINLHIIVEYGVNIPAVSETISSTVSYRVQEYTGLTVECVNIYVEGIRLDG